MKVQIQVTLDDVLKTIIETEGGLVNELKAQAFEEFIHEAEEKGRLDFYYGEYTADRIVDILKEHIGRLRGEK